MGIQYFIGQDANSGTGDVLYAAPGTGSNAAKPLVSLKGLYTPNTPAGPTSSAFDNPPAANFSYGYLSLGSQLVFTAVDSYATTTFVTGGSTVSLLDPSNGGAVSDASTVTASLHDPLETQAFIGAGGKPMIAFVANVNGQYSAAHYEIATSDGTAAGTRVATALATNTPTVQPTELVSAGTFVAFDDFDAAGNNIEYATDGISTNVLDPVPGTDSAIVNNDIVPVAFVNTAGKNAVAFVTNAGERPDNSGNYGSYINVSNGTGGAGTTQFKLTSEAGNIPTVSDLVSSRSNVFAAGFYFGTNPNGGGIGQLFSTDGVTEGVVAPAADGTSNAYDETYAPTAFVNAAGQGEAVFIGEDTTYNVPGNSHVGHNQELYVTTGALGRTAVEATHGVRFDYTTGGLGQTAFAIAPVVSGSTIYVVGQPDGPGGNQVYATSGGVAVRLDPNAASAAPTILDAGSVTAFTNAAGVAGVAFFANTNLGGGLGYQLLTSNGQAGGTTAASGYAFVKAPTAAVVSNSRVFFVGQVSGSLSQAFSSDGKTVTLLDTSAAGSPPGLSDAGNITAFTTAAGVNGVAFSANVGTVAAPNYQVFVSDGTGTRNVTNGLYSSSKPPGYFNTNNSGFVVNGGEVYWSALDAAGNQQLYSSDGTQAVKVAPVGDPTHVFLEAAAVVVTGADVTARNAVQPDAKSGTTAYTFNAERSGDLTQAVTLTYTVAGSGANPASAGMFTTPLTGTVSFAQGQSLSILSIGVKGQALAADAGFTVTLTGQDGTQTPATYASVGASNATVTAKPVYVLSTASGTIQQNATAQPTPTPTPNPTPTPTPSANPSVASFVASTLPASGYNATGIALASAGLGAVAGSGTVAGVTSANGSFGAVPAGTTAVAVATAPAAGSTLALPSGYAGLVAGGSAAVTLGDGGAAGAVLVGNGAGDTFNSTGAGVSLVGGQGANRFNVSGSAAVATGDGKNTVQATGSAAVQVTTGAGGSTVVLAGGASTVQANGQDTVFGGAGTATVTAANGAVAIGGDGLMTFIGGTATSVVFGGKGGLNFTGGSAFDIVVGTTGPVTARAGSGGGEFFGNGGGDLLQSGSGQTIMVLNAGGKAVSTGVAGNYLVAGAGTAVLDGSAATGNDVFFGGNGQDTILCGSGNDLIGTGAGTSTVQLGSGNTTVFAFGTSTVTAGSGSATVVMGGTVGLNIASGAARSFALFNFVPGTDKIGLSGYDAGTVGNAIANQVNSAGQTVLTLSDSTQIQLIGVARADATFFK